MRRAAGCAHVDAQRATGARIAETARGVGSKGVAIYVLANFCLACADHGKQLISLLPV
jgi:hypothetical protein